MPGTPAAVAAEGVVTGMGKVTLVGAGPGDAGLITVKGLKKLKTCDVVIYDRLSSDDLLKEVKEGCILVYVGKKPGAHSMKQEEINRVLVEYGRNYADVVRLKGGDSFVFGRGGEEILALEEAGIPYEVVPGITSSIAVPEQAGIPVTHRGIARSFHVITGHTMNQLPTEGERHLTGEEDTANAMLETGKLTDDYETLAKLDGTLVFLMGLSNLEKIAERLLRYGKAPRTPAAVIANGTTPYEKTVRGTLSDIAKRAREADLASPVVIVIGETAALHFKMEHSGPVKKYGMIGTARTMENFQQALQEAVSVQRAVELQGNETWDGQKAWGAAEVIPLIEMQVCGTEHVAELEQEMEHIPDYDWILFTSKQAVESFFQTLQRKSVDIRNLAGCRFGVIGQGTGKALEVHGIRADFMPEQADAEAFARQLAGQFARRTDGEKDAASDEPCVLGPDASEQEIKRRIHVLIPRAAQGNPVLGEILREAGMEVCEIPVYDVVGKSYGNFSRAAELKNFVFFSASGVRAFFAEMAAQSRKLPAGSRCYCIGHQTRRELERAIANTPQNAGGGMPQIITAGEQSVEGMPQIITAAEQSVDGLVQVILEDME